MGYYDIRLWVKEMYPDSQRWAKKVDAMPDNQVYAIYVRNLYQQEIPDEDVEPKPPIIEQGTLF